MDIVGEFRHFSISVCQFVSFSAMRPDRFITLNLVRPLHAIRRSLRHPRPSDGRGAGGEGSSSEFGVRSSDSPLPILMYHSINDALETGVTPYYRTVTSPSVFSEQMSYLSANGYRGVDLSTGLAWLNSETRNPELGTQNSRPETRNPKLVVLTFDDGFRDFHTAAFPVLQKHGFTTTMFLSTAFIGETHRSFSPRVQSKPKTQNSKFKIDLECLTWNEIREMQKAGIEFGSHTVSHPKLYELDFAEIESELRNSKLEIEERLGVSCPTFAYPYAFPGTDADFTKRFHETLKSCGYSCCVTTEVGRVGRTDNFYRLKRLPVNSLDDTALLQAKLDGAYDWLAMPQTMVKKFKSSVVGTKKPASNPEPARSEISI
jgi:peptidoglycan/xylan/chitin deacetylase (PgdA/CDA1 family)